MSLHKSICPGKNADGNPGIRLSDIITCLHLPACCLPACLPPACCRDDAPVRRLVDSYKICIPSPVQWLPTINVGQLAVKTPFNSPHANAGLLFNTCHIQRIRQSRNGLFLTVIFRMSSTGCWRDDGRKNASAAFALRMLASTKKEFARGYLFHPFTHHFPSLLCSRGIGVVARLF